MIVGQKQKKIDINIPKLDDFIHKVYIHVARKIYKNVYLFELNMPPLQVQKHNRELEVIVQECILNSLRESVPVEAILKAYMDETMEEDVIEEVKEEYIQQPVEVSKSEDSSIGGNANQQNEEHNISSSKLSFSDVDLVKDQFNNEERINAPKDIQRLEEISELRNNQRKLESDDDDDDGRNNQKLLISDESVKIHGITNKISEKKGINLTLVLKEFFNDLQQTDVLVGHNVSFDINMVKIELMRLIYSSDINLTYEERKFYKHNLYYLTNQSKIVCTVKESVDICNIKAIDKFGKEYLKYPKLVELHQFLFGSIPNNLHNSLNDILITLRCYVFLKFEIDLYKSCKKFKKMAKVMNLL
jgi:DNA polymerase III epsilon subunit-like protein